ncbi:MAG: DUF3991 and toprim domain-containing protein [Rhodospirillales bacterium]|nr:DUF3991 and toprim domain-containing protein [Rhodospirillales bacterium]
MGEWDQELEQLRMRVDCRVVLERDGWTLDRRESTRRAVKYRRGAGKIIIVIHGGRGWFDPLSDAKGDVFTLARFLWGGSFRDVCASLRPLVGVESMPRDWERRQDHSPPVPLLARWSRRGVPRPGSPTWCYLTVARSLPAAVLECAIATGLLREAPRGSLWAAHLDAAGHLTGWEERGPRWRGFATGGMKVLFRLGASEPHRLCVTEAAIDAMSLAALEALPADTLYVSTGGGWGPASVDALHALASTPGVELVAATDRNAQGERYAERLAVLATETGCAFRRLAPELDDWNDQLRAPRRTAGPGELGRGTSERPE